MELLVVIEEHAYSSSFFWYRRQFLVRVSAFVAGVVVAAVHVVVVVHDCAVLDRVRRWHLVNSTISFVLPDNEEVLSRGLLVEEVLGLGLLISPLELDRCRPCSLNCRRDSEVAVREAQEVAELASLVGCGPQVPRGLETVVREVSAVRAVDDVVIEVELGELGDVRGVPARGFDRGPPRQSLLRGLVMHRDDVPQRHVPLFFRRSGALHQLVSLVLDGLNTSLALVLVRMVDFGVGAEDQVFPTEFNRGVRFELLRVVRVEPVWAAVLGAEVLEGREGFALGAERDVVHEARTGGREQLEFVEAVLGRDGRESCIRGDDVAQALERHPGWACVAVLQLADSAVRSSRKREVGRGLLHLGAHVVWHPRKLGGLNPVFEHEVEVFIGHVKELLFPDLDAVRRGGVGAAGAVVSARPWSG